VHKNPQGQRQIFLARVCPGIETSSANLEKENWAVLKINPATGKKFDSVTDNPGNDAKVMYVVFSNDQSYPQYVITFS
jgi:hypothetical protein